MKRALLTVCLLFLPALVHADTTQDVVTGNGSPGPYNLTWKGIASGTEIVQVGTLPQTRGIDYTVNADAGTITWMRPLTASDVASVRYDYDPAHAVRTGAAPVIPLAVDLARAGQASLALSARLCPGDTGASGASGPLSVGMQGGLHAANGNVGAQIVYAPAVNGDGNNTASDASRAGAGVTGELGHAGQPLHLSAGWTRAGANVGDAGMTAGQQTFSVRADTSAASHFSASAGVTQTATLAADASSSGPVTTVTTASVQASPARTTQLGANFTTTNAPGTAADAMTTGITASLAPARTVALNAGLNLSQQGTQDVRRQAAGVTLSPSSVLSLNAGVGARDAGATGFTFTTLGALMRPTRGLEVSGTYTGRAADPADAVDNLDSTAARVALAPFGDAVRLTGTYAQNPDNGGDFAQHLAQRGLGLETRVGALNLSGGYNWTRDLSLPGDAGGGTCLTVNMGLRLSGATQVTGGCTQTLQGLAASSGTNLYTLGLSHAIGNSVSLSLSGAMQAPINAALPASPNYTANAALGLRF